MHYLTLLSHKLASWTSHFRPQGNQRMSAQQPRSSLISKSKRVSNSPTLFSALPRDAILYIFRTYLSPHDLRAVSETCSAARMLACLDECWTSILPDVKVEPGTNIFTAAMRMLSDFNGQGLPRTNNDGSHRALLNANDPRGHSRVSVEPGNEAVAHLSASSTASSAFSYWSRYSSSYAPGISVLYLNRVCWLDVRSIFRDLPNSVYTISFHVLFDVSPNRVYMLRDIENIRLTIQTCTADGCVRDERNCGAPFRNALRNQNLYKKWLRLDVPGVAVLPGSAFVRVRIHHTEDNWKENIAFGRFDAVPEPPLSLSKRPPRGDEMRLVMYGGSSQADETLFYIASSS